MSDELKYGDTELYDENGEEKPPLDPVPELEAGGETRRLGLLMPPPGYEDDAPRLLSATGFRPWDKNRIIEFIRNKPYGKRRNIFTPDWMQNQRSWGSCNACAESYVQRKGQFLRGRHDTPMLNWEFAYAQINGGRDNGSLLKDSMAEALSTGLPILDPAANGQGRGYIYKKHYTQADYDAAKLNKGTIALAVNDELTLATAVLAGFPAVVAVHAGNSFMKMTGEGIAGVDRGAGNHAVHVDDVEYSGGRFLFDHQGSWGTNVHDAGRAYLTWDGHFAQTIKYHQFWILMSTNDGDDPLPK